MNALRGAQWKRPMSVIALCVALAACSQPPSGMSGAAPTSTSPPIPEPTSVVPSTAEPSSEDPSETQSASVEPTEPAGTGPTVVRGAARVLGLSDAFNRGEWDEGSFTPVHGEPLQALGVSVGCNDSQPEVLEFRFSDADAFVLHAKVAQDLFSPNHEATLEFALVVDGSQRVTKRITFEKNEELEVSLNGVAVVELTVKHPSGVDNECNDDIKALVTQLTVTSG